MRQAPAKQPHQTVEQRIRRLEESFITVLQLSSSFFYRADELEARVTKIEKRRGTFNCKEEGQL